MRKVGMENVSIYKHDRHIFVNGFLVSKYSKDSLRDVKKLLAETLGEVNKNLKNK